MHGTCIYHRNLQFQSSSRQILMCRLCGEHLFTSRESPNDPPTNINIAIKIALWQFSKKKLLCSSPWTPSKK